MEPMSLSLLGLDTPNQVERFFVFRSPAMRALHSLATQVAGSDASILIYGESGTGKELFARLLHILSHRSNLPFFPVNCGILQGELFADKFFGHEVGAYTGAGKVHKGVFETVGGGTLFLDEVGEIPVTNQVDFLRVLEEKNFRRMGSNKDIPFEARIVAATNRSLESMVHSGEFRADLFYRLNVVPVQLPPLRERVDDIALLTEFLFEQCKLRYHRHDLTISDAVLTVFQHYPWPGNVRELKNVIERLVLLAADPIIDVAALPLDLQQYFEKKDAPPPLAPVKPHEQDATPLLPDGLDMATAVKNAEISAIIRAFTHAGGHKGNTAKLLKISERNLRYKVAEYKLDL